MRFTIEREPFVRALSRANGIAGKKQSMPILANALIEARRQGGVTVSATDLDLTYVGQVKADVEAPGRITVDAKRLLDVVRSMPASSAISVELGDSDRLTLKVKRVEVTLLGMSADGYPSLPDGDEVNTAAVDTAEWVRLIERTAFCISTDESRPNLNGVFLLTPDGGEKLRMVSTDGHRLAQAEVVQKGEGAFVLSHGVIIPKRGLAEIKALIEEVPGVTAGLTGNGSMIMVSVNEGEEVLFARLIDAAFPDYRQVIPKSIDGWFRVPRVAMLGALRRIGLLASERTHGVRLTPSVGELLLVSDNPDLGKAREEIEIEGYKGDGQMTLAINAKYLQEALSALGGVEAVEIGFNDPLSPVMVRVAGEPEAFRHIIMPMRV